MRHFVHAVACADTGAALAPAPRTLCVGQATAPRLLVALRGRTLGLLPGLATTGAATVAIAAITATAQHDLRAAPGAQVQAGVLFHVHPGSAEVLDGRVPARHTGVAPPSSHGVPEFDTSCAKPLIPLNLVFKLPLQPATQDSSTLLPAVASSGPALP